MAKATAKRKSRAVPGGPGPGKPKRVFTPEQIVQMEDYAYQGCMTETIANLMDIPRETIDTRPDIQRILTKKRCERKLNLRRIQNKTAKTVPVMQIWLGKNVLGQTDKNETVLKGTIELTPPQIT